MLADSTWVAAMPACATVTSLHVLAKVDTHMLPLINCLPFLERFTVIPCRRPTETSALLGHWVIGSLAAGHPAGVPSPCALAREATLAVPISHSVAANAPIFDVDWGSNAPHVWAERPIATYQFINFDLNNLQCLHHVWGRILSGSSCSWSWQSVICNQSDTCNQESSRIIYLH